jgi:hypothetical protein
MNMNIKTALFAAAFAASVLTAGTAAQAAPITLFNTGVDASGTPLADGTVGDPHYSLVAVPSGTTDVRVRTSAGGFPIPPYFGDDALSAWIGPNNDAQVDGPVGLYDYQTTFSLAGFNAATASISGGWSSDNDGVRILLNGVDTLNSPTDFSQFSAGFAAFSITSGFSAGVNTLDFIVNNGGGPTALRVEMTGAADLAGGVPEPATWAMMLAGFGGVGALMRSRRRVAAATA